MALAETLPFSRRGAFLRCSRALLLGRGLTLSPFSDLGLSLGGGLALPAICSFGMHRTCQDNRVKAQSSWER